MNLADFFRHETWLGNGFGPRYVQLRSHIETGIAEGLLKSNTQLPPEREIAQLTGMSRVTVRNAIQELVNTGVIVQKQGSGSFIADKPRRVEQSLSLLTSFTEDMRQRGMSTSAKWLERGAFAPSPSEISTLSLAPGDCVARIARLRIAGDRPMALERAALPLDILPNPLEVTQSLYETLALTGNRPVRATQKISAINLNADDAGQLGVEIGVAGLSIQRISSLANGRVIEFTKSIYRGDAYEFIAELQLTS